MDCVEQKLLPRHMPLSRLSVCARHHVAEALQHLCRENRLLPSSAMLTPTTAPEPGCKTKASPVRPSSANESSTRPLRVSLKPPQVVGQQRACRTPCTVESTKDQRGHRVSRVEIALSLCVSHRQAVQQEQSYSLRLISSLEH